MFCPNCGREQESDMAFCRACGARMTGVARGVTKETSWAWWLLPVFLTWAGGLIAWLVLKDDNPRKAKQILIFGICWTVAQLILSIVFLIVWFVFLFAMIGTES